MTTTTQTSRLTKVISAAHDRPSLLATGLFGGIVGGIGALVFALEHYQSIWAATMYVLSDGDTFWFPLLASLACWAVGYTILTIKADGAWFQIAPLIILEALFLAAATLHLSTTPPQSLYQIIFIIAGYVLPLGLFGGAALVLRAQGPIKQP